MPRKQAFPQVQSRRVFGHPIRVGLYARVSTLDQQTLPLQIRALREYAAKRGWSIVAQIKEVGSGASQRELREALLSGRSSARNRCRTGVASGSLGPVRRRPGIDAPGTSASRRGIRFVDRSARSDHTRGSRHGRTARSVRRVRTRDPTRTCPRRLSSCPAARQTPRPPAIGGSQSRRRPKAAPARHQQIRDRTPASN